MAHGWWARGCRLAMLLAAGWCGSAAATPVPGPLPGAAVHAQASVTRLQGRPYDIALNCRRPPAPGEQVIRLEAPEGGWPAWSQSVLVLDAPPGLVRIHRGREARCGLSLDSRSSDTRFRSGVGATLAPAEGSREPILVIAPSNARMGWGITVRYGDPAPVQREDTLRFAIRVGGLAILLAMLLSSILIAATARDRVAALFALATGAFALWIALRSGLSGWPRPWLPSDAASFVALAVLPVVIVGANWYVTLTYGRVDRSLPWLYRSRHAAFAVAGLLAAVLLFGAPAVSLSLADVWRPFASGVLVASMVVALLTWRAGQAGGKALVVALVPPCMVMASQVSPVLRPWFPESMLVTQAWYTVAMTIAMSLRMGALRRQRDRLRMLAERDPLTHLPNRRAMAATLPRRVDEARAHGRPIAVVFVDIDHFKAINDTHGHAVGDEVLVEVARRLGHGLRGGDLASRHGGEEFVLMLPGANAARARGLAERLRAALAETPVQTSAGLLHVTASLGVAELLAGDPGGASGAAVLIARADVAMYRAKQSGRNRVEGPAPT